MFNSDTKNPLMRTLFAAFRMLLNNRGEVGDGEGEGDGGDGATDWKATLPENIKAHPVLSKYKTSNDAIAALVDAQKLIGADKIIIPGKEATPEEWNERVWNRLGRPGKPEDYALPTDLEIPKDLPMDKNLVDGFKKFAHDSGLLPGQFAGAYKWYMGQVIAQHKAQSEAQVTAQKESETALRTEWGAAYDQNLALARKVVNQFADEKSVAALTEGLGNDPRVVRLFAKVGKVLSEDQLSGKGKQLTATPTEALEQIAKLEGDLSGPLYNANHPEHEAVKAKRDALYHMAYPEQQ